MDEYIQKLAEMLARAKQAQEPPASQMLKKLLQQTGVGGGSSSSSGDMLSGGGGGMGGLMGGLTAISDLGSATGMWQPFTQNQGWVAALSRMFGG